MTFKVTLRDGADHNLCCGDTPKHYLTLPQAIHGMKKLAYDKLEAFGKLDTIAAHEVMRMIHDASTSWKFFEWIRTPLLKTETGQSAPMRSRRAVTRHLMKVSHTMGKIRT